MSSNFSIALSVSLMSDKLPKVFWEVHSGLPREGPGDNESTRKAYLMLKGLPENPCILDIGCGPGMQTIELAKLSNGRIDAFDNHQPFLEDLKRRAEKEGVSKKIRTVNGDMFALNYENSSFDLIWSEGAIYIIGFEKGLREWRNLLTNKRYLVVSEVSWLKPDPPEEVKKLMNFVNLCSSINQSAELADYTAKRAEVFYKYESSIKEAYHIDLETSRYSILSKLGISCLLWIANTPLYSLAIPFLPEILKLLYQRLAGYKSLVKASKSYLEKGGKIASALKSFDIKVESWQIRNS